MKGLFKTAPGKGNISIDEKPTPAIQPDQVLIKVKAAGICGSDIHIYNWDTQLPMNPPMIIGHEFSGIIEKTGTNVKDWSVGDRVTAEPTFSNCGKCQYCNSGAYNMCPERKVLGFYTDGAMAEYTVVPAKRLHRIPDSIDFTEGAMIEPFACCVHCVSEVTDISFNDTVVISGPGAIGLLTLQTCKVIGCKVIMLGTDADEERLRLASDLGADLTINVFQKSYESIVREFTSGIGADVAIECSGAPAAVDMNINLLKKRGQFTQIGLFGKPITVDFEKISYKELIVRGTFAQKWSAWRTAIQLLSEKKVDLKPLISDVLPLDDWQKGFDKLNRKEGLKIILTP
jgi:L-iditol 2-dehydrogenase